MTELTYQKNGDYLIPNLTLAEQEQEVKPLGKYGRMRKKYLQEHRPVLCIMRHDPHNLSPKRGVGGSNPLVGARKCRKSRVFGTILLAL